MRAFIAMELPELFADETAYVAQQLSRAIQGRYTPRENYHITLAFLGEIDEVQVRDTMEAMDEISAQCVRLIPDGIGKFGKPSNATLWMGLSKDPGLMNVTEQLRTALKTNGVPFDDKPFLPHITLARHAVLPKSQLPDLLFPQEATAGCITLFKSTLNRDHSVYKPLYSISLDEAIPFD